MCACACQNTQMGVKMILVVLCAASGVGKTTIKDELKKNNLLEGFACLDTDQVGICWWDYKGTEREDKFNDDCLKEAVRQAEGKNLLFSACMNPLDYYSKVSIPTEITSTYFIAMTCSDEEIVRRLRARPAECMCGSDDFIREQINYNNWFKENKGKFQLYIDNTELSIQETAKTVLDFQNRLCS